MASLQPHQGYDNLSIIHPLRTEKSLVVFIMCPDCEFRSSFSWFSRRGCRWQGCAPGCKTTVWPLLVPLTGRGTFQKFFDQAELKSYLETVLETDAIPGGIGIFYLFKDETRRQQFLANCFRRREIAPRRRVSELRFEENRELLDAFMAAVSSLGRLPDIEEWPQAQAVVERFGSLKRTFAFVQRFTASEQWESIAGRRTEDILGFPRFANDGLQAETQGLANPITIDDLKLCELVGMPTEIKKSLLAIFLFIARKFSGGFSGPQRSSSSSSPWNRDAAGRLGRKPVPGIGGIPLAGQDRNNRQLTTSLASCLGPLRSRGPRRTRRRERG